MTCKNLIALCAKTHLPCPHATNDGVCDHASCDNETVPTFKQAIEIYSDTHKARALPITIQNTVKAFEYLLKLSGLSVDNRVTDMDSTKWEYLLAKMSTGISTEAKDGGYTDYSIVSYLRRFRAVLSTSSLETRNRYKALGLVPYDCDLIPQHPVIRHMIEELSAEQKAKLDHQMHLLLVPTGDKRKDNGNRRLYIWTWFASVTGMRPNDIAHLTWSCIKRDPIGKRIVEYVPQKTKRYRPDSPAVPVVSDYDYERIKPFIDAPDEPVIPFERNKGAKSKTHGGYCDSLVGLHRRANKLMRSVGVKGHMAAYMWRRLKSKTCIEDRGPLAEAQELGHNIVTSSKHYYNLPTLKLK